MQIFKKIIPILIIMILTFTACGKPAEDNSVALPTLAPVSEKKDFVFTLPYTDQDGFNPYITGNNLSLQNSNLVFTKIVEITPEFEIVKKSVKNIINSDINVVLDVDTEVCYADGSHITAEDMAASIEAARVSSFYASRFTNISEVKVEGNSVFITLLLPDARFEYLLDIPVIKASEMTLTKPTANGRYTYSKNGLERNPKYEGKLPFENIKLIELAGYDALSGSLSTGAISFYFSDKETVDYGINVARQNYYKMNNLVYLGVNGATYEGFIDTGKSNTFVKKPIGRKVILDRQIMVEKAYYSRGFPATGAFNPAYPKVFEAQTISAAANLDNAKTAIEGMGFKKDLDGFYKDGDENKISLRLLCYSGSANKRYVASLVKAQLENFGIEVNLDEVDDFEQYKQKIAKGDFDMYIGEVKLYNNMSLSPFFNDDGALRAFLQESDVLKTSWENASANKGALADFEKNFANEMPYVPLLWRSGVVCYSKELNSFSPSVSDVFYNFENVTLN
ncbi:MAG: ABC transporter substrate-binding protein [Oscillospiraceae bacterium]